MMEHKHFYLPDWSTKMNERQAQIYGTGTYMPGRRVSDEEMGTQLGFKYGWTLRVERSITDKEVRSSR